MGVFIAGMVTTAYLGEYQLVFRKLHGTSNYLRSRKNMVKLKKSTRKNKKYMVLHKGKWIHFGDTRYQQFKDQTMLKLYSHLDHGDVRRKKLYYARHGPAKPGTAKYFAHKYLW